MDSERRRLRRTLIARLDDNSRRLLLRTSLLHGRFQHALGRSLADVPPDLPVPGELLNSLLGAWIDEVGRDRLRVRMTNAADAAKASETLLSNVSMELD